MVIGPFYVNTDSVRVALAKKHKEIARALLDFLVEQLRKDTEQVLKCTIRLMSKIRWTIHYRKVVKKSSISKSKMLNVVSNL